MTGVGLLAYALVTGLAYFHIIVPQQGLEDILVKGFEFVTLVTALIGQVRRKDLVAGIVRRYQ